MDELFSALKQARDWVEQMFSPSLFEEKTLGIKGQKCWEYSRSSRAYVLQQRSGEKILLCVKRFSQIINQALMCCARKTFIRTRNSFQVHRGNTFTCRCCHCSRSFFFSLIFADFNDHLSVDPAMIGILCGLILMFIIICVVLRMFSKLVLQPFNS